MNTTDGTDQDEVESREEEVATENDALPARNDIEQARIPVETDENPEKCLDFGNILKRSIIIFGHMCFIGFAVSANFIYEWSNDSGWTVWFALTNESVIQHLKTISWPWLLILLPMDVLARRVCVRNGLETEQKTWYFRCISKSSWLSLCLATTVAMLSAMLFISILFTISLYSGSKSLAVDITIYMICVIAGIVLRMLFMKREAVMVWAAFIYLQGGVIWFFTYFSYSKDVYEGFWLQPDPYNHTSEGD
ncbi:hypothetical protein IV203_010178 [Nitzschia inconspicua]|uniref:Uncharacterized protein n=1 Tax=Nitzschia inconspicua TaxID=303405 RepID=A0A9K3PKP1_9STRA|nr:hypothetical protein IV203_010178 [Nitzschia inconspicua]